MPILNAQKITFTLPTGESLFSDISLSIDCKFSAIIGRNGVGKSVLASILAGKLRPESGQVSQPFEHLGYFSQQSQDIDTEQSIAQFMGVATTLEAITRIESGQYSTEDLTLIGDNWQAGEHLIRALGEIAITSTLETRYSQLSGGEQAKLRLLKLFNSKPEFLILDEPSNHMDAISRQWLLSQIKKCRAKVLLISHDRTLLHHVDIIFELTSLGLTQYLGNYHHFQTCQQTHLAALERKLTDAHSRQKQLTRLKQLNLEKAQQRASSGKRLRKSTSQAKVLLNTMRDKAEKSASSRKIQSGHLLAQNRDTLNQLSLQKESVKPQKLYFQEAEKGIQQKRSCLLSIQALKLPYTNNPPLNFQLLSGDKLWLSGHNGCGKSTLMKVILGNQSSKSGQVYRGAPLFYLDQHFDLIKPELSLLEHLCHYCLNQPITQSHTLLAGIGFRGQSVHKKASKLSGGEKMKLCMLIVSHQTPVPLLLLDEPDNHLDIESKTQLSETLSMYQGSFILVSHDSQFIKGSVVTHTIELTGKENVEGLTESQR
ncbi:ATP-binding cassette domain-containing protein [Shewanella sp. UCD-KL12]|uniref:ATP-binding cassette domain-containing protein n=1 Tax=Shewanella sp. UCD-KL12 TaxID=1917163 RepID=UPI000971019E|nr:ATP-binding cassette domain-containing protein [Shewanella sp. UCD-KL12]